VDIWFENEGLQEVGSGGYVVGKKSDTILLPLLLIAGCLRATTNAGRSATGNRNFRLIFRCISARNLHCFRRVFGGAAT
jgi:hypothetical protein